MTRYLAILTVRNEAAFLLEWLAHHRAVGFTDFLVFSNDCDDGTDVVLDRLDDLGQLTHVRNVGPFEKGVQWVALNTADKHPLVKQADWIMPIDIDEFVNIHVGDHTLDALTTALPEATAIPMTWRLFGNNGVRQFRDAPITEQFTKAAPVDLNWPWRAAMFKTLFRNDGAYKKLGVHRPRSPVDDRVENTRWFDGSGRELAGQFKRNRLFSNYGQDNYQLVQLNHYALGAMESYVLKRDRGRSNRSDADTGMSYWVERNWCDDTDVSVNALSGPRDEVLDALFADKTLNKLHHSAVEWRKARFAKLMQEEPNRALFARLMMTPPAQRISPQAVRFMLKFRE